MIDPRLREGVEVRVGSELGHLDELVLGGSAAIVRIPRKVGLGGCYIQRWPIEDVEYVSLGHATPYGCLLATTPEGMYAVQVSHRCEFIGAVFHACAELRDVGRDPATATWSFIEGMSLWFVKAMADIQQASSTGVDITEQ